MEKKRKLIYIDHVVGPISVDLVNLLSHHLDVTLYHGESIFTYNKYSPNLVRRKKNAYNKRSLLTRSFSWVLFYLRTLPELIIKKKKFDLFLVSNPPLNPIVGYVFNKLFKIDYYLWIFDIYPDIIVRSGIVSKKNPLVRLWTYLNVKSLNKAKHIFTISDSMLREVQKYLKDDFVDISVVHNWADSDFIKPIIKTENIFIKNNSLEEKFIVMYSGNLGKTHDLNTILETANLLREYAGIAFIIIGEGDQKNDIVERSKKMQLNNVMHFSFQEPEMFLHSIACADIGFVTLGEGFELYSVPSKTYYLLASATPIIAIANMESELSQIIVNYECGFRYNSGEAKAIASKILELYSTDGDLQILKNNALKASENFTIENANIIVDKVLK